MRHPAPSSFAEIVVDLAAIRDNVRALRRHVAPAELMVVVKANGYGHGLVESGRAARQGGATWLGVATLDEALHLRAHGDTGPILCWLDVPGMVHYHAAVLNGIDVTAYTLAELADVAQAARDEGATARVQLKVDTGLSRGGCALAEWPDLVAWARRLSEKDHIQITGIWSHYASADDPDHPSNQTQEAAFREALDIAAAAGLTPQIRHLANSAAAIMRPESRFDLVRCGIAAYGLDPAPGHTPDLGLTPAMSVRTRLALSKRISAGSGVSYGHTWVADTDTSVGLVPIGYGDGIPRHASHRAEVLITAKRRPLRGRVCMDQFVVDLEGDLPAPGTPVTVFGPGHEGEPTAQDWATAADTISYEIVTRLGGRMSRRYLNEAM